MDGTPRVVELDTGDLTVSCHVRAPMLLEPVDAHVETLRACEREGRIDGLMLRSWPEQVTLSESADRDVLERFESFRAWADRAGVDVQPPFETRTRRSMVTGTETDLLVLPLICLALYDDASGIVGVYPHSVEGETYTVEDAIARLRTGEVPVPLSATPTRIEYGDVCPECKGLLVNGQGLYTCPDCAWVGTVESGGDYVALRPKGSGPAVDVSVAPGASDPATETVETTAEASELEAERVDATRAPDRADLQTGRTATVDADLEGDADSESELETEPDGSPTPTS